MQKRSTIAGPIQSARMHSNVWLTPPYILRALGVFDLDPCAAPEPRPWPTARRHIALPVNGLTEPWTGRVWLNPPYNREARRWLHRLAEHGNGVALTFARTDTTWFRETVWERADAVMFLFGRITFHRWNGVAAAANGGAPSVLAAYGPQNVAALNASGLSGVLTYWKSTKGLRISDPELPYERGGRQS